MARANDYNDLTPENADDVLESVHAWASLASYAAARAYAPSSPWPRRAARGLAGWGAVIGHQVRRIIAVLLSPLSAAARTLGAIDYAIGITFPWSAISMSFTWQ